MPKPMTAPSNPIYPGYFADPFVWRHGGTYYAIGNGEREAEGLADGGGSFRCSAPTTSSPGARRAGPSSRLNRTWATRTGRPR
jgi:hypothetical protein